jgi:hypothetical protein
VYQKYGVEATGFHYSREAEASHQQEMTNMESDSIAEMYEKDKLLHIVFDVKNEGLQFTSPKGIEAQVNGTAHIVLDKDQAWLVMKAIQRMNR